MGRGPRQAEARRGAAIVAPPRRLVLRNSALALVAAVAVGGVLVAAAAGGGSDGGGPVPGGLVSGGVAEGLATASVEIVVVEDLQCPACQAFEQTTGPTLDRLVADGAARVVRRPVAFLDRASSDRYSSRAMNALGCVADASPSAGPAFAASLFREQPSEGGPGLPDARLAELAAAAGAADVGACVQEERFSGWVASSTADALEDVDSTPTVVVDGRRLADTSPDAVLAAVAEAR